jgi:hypothetical protein
MDPTIDPEFRDLLPPLSKDEYAKLEASILADGCHSPIWLWKGIVADGHNRLEICTRHHKPYQVNYLDKPDRDSVMLWMLDNQGGRRNLADIDRIAIARKTEEIVARQAKANQIRKPESVLAISPEQTPVNTRKEAAKAAGVGEKKYDEGKTILAAVEAGEVAPAVVDEIRKGTASVHKVATDIKEKRKAAAVAKAEASTPKPEKRTGDLKKIEDVMGDVFARAVEIGTILKTPHELKAFMALDPADQKAVEGHVIKGWTVAKALRFIRETIDRETRIADLINLCIDAKGKFVVSVGAYTITTEFTGKD